MIMRGKSRMRQALAAEGGFTLVEMLVAVTLIGLLAIGLASAMGLGIKTWNTSGVTAERLDALRAAQNTLRQALTSIYPHWTLDNPAFVEFSGSSDAIEFIAPAPLAFDHPGFSRFHLAAVRLDDMTSLILKLRPDENQSDTTKWTDGVVIFSSTSEIEFSYYGPGSTTLAPSWQSVWQKRPELPRLIKIEATSRNPDAVTWPALIVKPAIDVDVTCEFDPLSRRCRGR
jgi:general secretion pathway protein J